MMAYEKLDAWKSCHALVLAVLEVTGDRAEQDPDLVAQLRWTAMRAAAKLAFGTGTRDRKMFRHAAGWSAGYLAEFAYHLSLARAMGVLAEAAAQRVDALRGRATFYTWQLLESLMAPGGGGPAGPA